eukprot:scpid72177/ scgid7197/ 
MAEKQTSTQMNDVGQEVKSACTRSVVVTRLNSARRCSSDMTRLCKAMYTMNTTCVLLTTTQQSNTCLLFAHLPRNAELAKFCELHLPERTHGVVRRWIHSERLLAKANHLQHSLQTRALR